MKQLELTQLLHEAQQGNEKSFDAFYLHMKKKCWLKLLNLTKSEFDAKDVFVSAMSKFWEEFIAGNKVLPQSNIEGYIYRMCCNAHHNLFRKKQRSKVDYVETIPEKKENDNFLNSKELIIALKADEAKFRAFNHAIDLLCTTCKQVIEVALEGKKNKEVWSSLGFKTITAYSQKKYNCIKKLTDYLFVELEKIKIQSNADSFK